MALYTRFLLKCSKPVNIYSRHWQSTVSRIDKLLIANRGEIACRVIRTARKLGVKTVAVYSDIDKTALHVALADEAYNIGEGPATKSYLRGDKIIEVAKKSKSQAIHPGYGFLSENVEFAEECAKEGVTFVGPPASAIQDMGIKSTSKAIMSSAGVPIIEGYHGEDQSEQLLIKEAKKIGFPIMIKAIRGGGGKGMRIAMCEEEFLQALESARSESQKAFGDSNVLLEKFVEHPRHVEVQVFADKHGNAVYLFERDCSVQRRHQKIIEEAPAPGLSEETRCKLGEAAVRAAKAVGYVGAGTVEFIYDCTTQCFYFMEMNTRLQVEHPITEMITGIDLVEWQLKIAAGEQLPAKQEEIGRYGWAFEARVYAENPADGFLPGAGPLLYLSPPSAASDVRVETGVVQGDEVSVHYDPMIAKLVVWGTDRMEALTKLQSKLVDYQIAGLETNINFLLALSRHPEFMKGNVHTNFIAEHNKELFPEGALTEEVLMQAALATALCDELQDITNAADINDTFNPFVIEGGFRVNYKYERLLKFKVKDQECEVKIRYVEPQKFMVSVDGKDWKEISGSAIKDTEGNIILSYNIDDLMAKSVIYIHEDYMCLFGENGKVQLDIPRPHYKSLTEGGQSLSSLVAIAPMPGVLDKILVRIGDIVKKDDPLFVMIAMKMEYVVKAHTDGKIADILYNIGINVPKDAVVVKFENPETE